MMFLMVAGALYVGNRACEPCHRAIFRSYGETPMAQSSGRVAGGLHPGSFRHAASGTDYAIDANGGVSVSNQAGRSDRKLDYFIGSGSAGRSFLSAWGGFLFQAPVTWYTREARWDISPGYEQDRQSRWSRPIEPECLACHGSQVRSAEGYRNRYADPPFAQDGIGCERCHGPGSEHIAGRGSLLNPAKLGPAKRDSVCAQCHMSGEARIARPGKSFLDYRAGELLSDYVSYFVYDGDNALKATSYVEKLAASRCKIASGDRLWCGTCHDPHAMPSAQEREAFYRARCEGCHDPAVCQRGPDCAACHMPKRAVQEVAHGMLTDHGISKVPPSADRRSNSDWRLRGFSAADSGLRERGLAYADVFARTGNARQADEAFKLLSTLPIAPSTNAASIDKDVDLHLASLYQRRGDLAKAAELYRSVLRVDPGSIVALVNLGNFYGRRGALDQAVALWRRALSRDPCQPESAANLKKTYDAQGNLEDTERLRKSQLHCVVGSN